MKRYAPIFGILMLVLSALACNLGLDENKNIIYEADLIFTGPGTDTWSWQQGALTCETQDEMKLTIAADNSAKLDSGGLCFFSRQVASDPCTSHESDLPCGFTLYGTYNPGDQKITWDSCNTPGLGNASGVATVTGDLKTMVDITVNGTGSCWFDGIDEQHRLDYSLPFIPPAQTP